MNVGTTFRLALFCDGGHATKVIEAGFTEGRNLIVIGQVRVDYETEIPGKVNWHQTNIRSKWKRMTGKFEKLL